jgi:3-hydroxyacyl-[acyl-carrier-protein] dehydratase
MNDYFHIESCKVEGDETLFEVTLLPDYCAYKGHFPENPVSPGVCNIQMIKECAQLLTGKRLFLSHIAKCRFSAVITPQKTPHLKMRMLLSEVDTLYKVQAVVFDDSTTYIEFKGEFTSATIK